MNLAEQKWFADFEIDGKVVESWQEQSLSAIITQFARALTLSSGAPKREILLRINPEGVQPQDSALTSNNPLDEAIKFEQPTKPMQNESAIQFYIRLQTDGLVEALARQFTNDWFPMQRILEDEGLADAKTNAWMTDAKVMRWSQLHLNREAYAKALPGEYQELRRYIESTYPERAEQIKWRTE